MEKAVAGHVGDIFMKKLSVLLLCIIFICLCTRESALSKKATLPPDIYESYDDVLKKSYEENKEEYKNNDNAIYSYYAFYDIDGDGTQELLLGQDTYWGEKLPDKNVYLYTVMATINGVVMLQEELPPWRPTWFSSSRWVLKNGIIKSEGNPDGMIRYEYHRFKNGELKLQKKLFVQDSSAIKEYYKANGEYDPHTPITKEEFNYWQKKLEGDGQIIEIDWKSILEYKQ